MNTPRESFPEETFKSAQAQPNTGPITSIRRAIGGKFSILSAAALSLGLAGPICAPTEEDKRVAMSEVIDSYPESVLVGDLVQAHISVEEVRKYASRFSPAHFLYLRQAGIPFEEAIKYDESRFSTVHIAKLVAQKVSAEDANRYPQHFVGEGICQLVELGVTPEKVSQYPKRFIEAAGFNAAHEITLLVSSGVDGPLAAQYPEHLGAFDIIELHKNGMNPETAKNYPQRFSGYAVAKLSKAKISPETAAKYPERFRALDIEHLVNAKISPEAAAKYPIGLAGETIVMLTTFKVSPQKATAYLALNLYGDNSIRDLLEAKISPKRAALYSSRFNYGFHIADLCKAGISPGKAFQYPDRFQARVIVLLFKAGVSGATATAYVKHADTEYHNISVEDIIAEEKAKGGKKNP